MTWTSAFGRGSGFLLDAIVRWLALARINPNVLTFLGLVVNTGAALLFGYANGANQARMFRYAGLVIIGSGFFDLVDGRVARASNQVTRFGGFFDSVVDRYSDAALFFGLLVYYARGGRFFYVVLTALVMISSIMVVSYWCAPLGPTTNETVSPGSTLTSLNFVVSAPVGIDCAPVPSVEPWARFFRPDLASCAIHHSIPLLPR